MSRLSEALPPCFMLMLIEVMWALKLGLVNELLSTAVTLKSSALSQLKVRVVGRVS